MSVLVVGISGVTNGGKSTLSKDLFKVLPFGTKLISQDDYFYPEDAPVHVPSPGGLNHYNWDVITAIDMDRMVNDMQLLISDFNKGKYAKSQSGDAVDSLNWGVDCKNLDLVEGKDSLFFHKSVGSLLKEINKQRSIILVDGFCIYDDPRLRGMCELKIFLTLDKTSCFQRRLARVYDPPDPPNYFDFCVWPMYEAHLQRIKPISDVNFYNGSGAIGDIFLDVLKKIVLTSKF